MDVKKTAGQLSEIEQKTLKALTSSMQEFEEITGKSGLQKDSVHRALQWLSQKHLIELEATKKTFLKIEELGKPPLPERRLLNAIKNETSLKELQTVSKLNQQEFSIALGRLKKNNLISINSGIVSLTSFGKEAAKEKLQEESLLEKISSKDLLQEQLEEREKNALQELIKRGLVDAVEKNFLKAKTNQNGEEAKKIIESGIKRAYNIFDPTPAIFIGKKQPYVQFLNNIRKTLIRLGFEEMQEQLIVQEFYNFDVLFQPQNHPARSWTDTYQLKRPTHGDLPAKEKVLTIARAHENGGVSGSKGWGYKWDPKIAAKLMPNAHGTSADARQMIQGVKTPAKYFVINRCYRPDVLDSTHLVEFNQLDGFIVWEKINFSYLLGSLKEVALQISGAKEVKFTTGYFPFTEPSCELYIKHPEIGWIEIGGAGLFRPEITQNLGIKEPVIAWGLGIDRLAMFRLGINDIRHLFSDDLNWLRKSKAVTE